MVKWPTSITHLRSYSCSSGVGLGCGEGVEALHVIFFLTFLHMLSHDIVIAEVTVLSINVLPVHINYYIRKNAIASDLKPQP